MAKLRTFLDGAMLILDFPASEPRVTRRYRGYGPLIEAIVTEFADCIAGFRFRVNGPPQLELRLVDGATAESLRERAAALAERLVGDGLAVWAKRDLLDSEEAYRSVHAFLVAGARAATTETLGELTRLGSDVRPQQDQAQASALPG